MKLLTKEEEDAHYREVVKGGTIGTACGLAAGYAGVLLASRRYHTIRNLTLPMKAFLMTSSGTFVGIIAADHASRAYEAAHNEERQWYENREERLRRQELATMTFGDRALAWARRERYKIVGVTWLLSMAGSFALVGRNPYLTGPQKVVQARVYAQGATLAVLVASAAFEISERNRVRRDLAAKSEGAAAGATAAGAVAGSKTKESQSPEEHNQGDLWKDMVAAEEERLKKKHRPLYEHHTEARAEAPKAPTAPAESPASETPAPSAEATKVGEKVEGENKQK